MIPSQVEQGLGSDLLNQIAAKTGLSPGETSSRLAGLLPDLVASVSPDGKIENGGIERLLKFVQGR